jgi:hypothetical protein
MMKSLLFAIAMTLALSTGCAIRGRGAYVVTIAPPPPPRAQVVVETRPGMVWIEGHWARHGDRWVWIDGYYERERPGYLWVQGYWDPRGDQYVWIEGHWQARASAGVRIGQ